MNGETVIISFAVQQTETFYSGQVERKIDIIFEELSQLKELRVSEVRLSLVEDFTAEQRKLSLKGMSVESILDANEKLI